MTGALEFLRQAAAMDLILAAVLLEAAALLVWRRSTGRGLPAASLIANLAAGACLLLALRLALTGGAAAAWIPACLAVALLAHVADLALRWSRDAGDVGDAGRP
jgi:hypothetical protein